MADAEKEEAVSPLSSFAQRMQKQAGESQRALDEHRTRLMNLISSRKQMPFDPALMGLARGLLAPTKTGSFGESAGYGLTGYAEETEKQFRREQEEAKMAYELEQAAQQQKMNLMGMGMLSELFSGEAAPEAIAAAPSTAPAAAPAAPPVVAAAAAPAKAPAAVTTEATAEAPKKRTAEEAIAVMPELALPKIPRSAIASASDGAIEIISGFNSTIGKILSDYRTAFRQGRELQIKEVNLQKELQELDLRKREVAAKEASVKRYLPGVGPIEMPIGFWNKLGEAKTFDDVKKLYQENNLPLNITTGADGVPRFMSESEIDVKKEREKARFSQPPVEVPIPELGTGKYTIDRVTWDEYRTAKAKGGKALQKFFDENFPEAGVVIPPTGRGAGTKVQSVEERAVQEERQKTLAQKGATATIEQDTAMANMADKAAQTFTTADDIFTTISDPKYSGAQGYFSQPGFKNAMVAFFKEGAKVGDYSVGLPAVEAALKKLGMTQDQIDAEALILQRTGELQMLASALGKNQGSVSDNERLLFRQISLSVDTPLKAMLSGMEALKARSVYQQRSNEAYKTWRKNNPSLDASQFVGSREDKSEKAMYESHLKEIRQKYFGGGRPAAPAARSEQPASSAGGSNPWLPAR